MEELRKKLEIAKQREKDIREGCQQALLYYQWKLQQLQNIVTEVSNLETIILNKETHN